MKTDNDTFYKGFGKWMPRASLAILGVLVLAGCSTTGSSGTTAPGEPTYKIEAVEGGEMSTITENSVIVEDASSVLVQVGGSGSCPPVIDKVISDGKTTSFYLKEYEQKPCTMDYRPYPQRIKASGSDTFNFDGQKFELCTTKESCTPLLAKDGVLPTA